MFRFAVLLKLGFMSGALALLYAKPAPGNVLVVEGPPLVIWNGGPSPQITLTVKNPSLAPQSLIGYNLDLFIEGAPGSTGVLKFNTATVAVSNYLFAGNSLFEPTSSISDTVLEDFSDFASGDIEEEKVIVAGDSYGLITFDFDATGLPTGFFHIKLPAFVGEMGPWYLPPDDAETFFANAPPDGDPAIVVIIGINVETQSVPEPSTLYMGAMISVFLMGWWALRGAGRRRP